MNSTSCADLTKFCSEVKQLRNSERENGDFHGPSDELIGIFSGVDCSANLISLVVQDCAYGREFDDAYSGNNCFIEHGWIADVAFSQDPASCIQIKWTMVANPARKSSAAGNFKDPLLAGETNLERQAWQQHEPRQGAKMRFLTRHQAANGCPYQLRGCQVAA